MAKQITELTNAGALDGTELAWVERAGAPFETSLQDIADLGSGGLTIEDEGSPLTAEATTLDFVGAGVVASGTGSTKTITIGGAGAGDVGVSGTPVDGQVAVWTDSATIEGVDDFQFDGSFLELKGAGPIGYKFENTTAATDEKKWEITADVSQLQFKTSNDAESAFDIFLVFNRQAEVVVSANWFTPMRTSASNATRAGLRVPEGVAPTVPEDGDIWVTAAGEFNVRLNEVTVDLAAVFVEVNDLTAAVTWANVPEANIPTHTGQVTGDTDLSLDVTAITDQGSSGTLIGADTIIVNDGGVLSEATMDQVKNFTGAGARGDAWTLETANFTLIKDDKKNIEATSADTTATVPATIAAGDEFFIHNQVTSTKIVNIEPNTGHTIKGVFGNVVGGSDTLVLALGDTVRFVAVSTSILEIV